MEKMKQLKGMIATERAEWLNNLIQSDGYGGNKLMIGGVRMYLRGLSAVEEMIYKIEEGLHEITG